MHLKNYKSVDLYTLLKVRLQQLDVRVFESIESGKPNRLYWQDTLGKLDVQALRPIAGKLRDVVRDADLWLGVNNPRQQLFFRWQVKAIFTDTNVDLASIENANVQQGCLHGDSHNCIRLVMTFLIVIANNSSKQSFVYSQREETILRK